jgi:hypothetical protein
MRGFKVREPRVEGGECGHRVNLSCAALRDRDYPGNDSAPLDDSRGALVLSAFLAAVAPEKARRGWIEASAYATASAG